MSEKEVRKCIKRLIEEINWRWFGDNLINFCPPTGPDSMMRLSEAWREISILYDAYCDAEANDMAIMLLLPRHAKVGTVLYTAQTLVLHMVQVSMGWEAGGGTGARQVKILKKILSGSKARLHIVLIKLRTC